MNLADLIARFRTDANDKAEPFFWDDDEVTAWLNDAVAEAAIRGRLIHESSDTAITQIKVTAGKSTYNTHPSLYEIDHIAFRVSPDSKRQPLDLVSIEVLDCEVRDWRDRQDHPTHALQGDKTIRLAPIPIENGTLLLEGYRVPKNPMDDEESVPEIHEQHHRHLVHWALHRAFSVPDSEAFDPKRAGDAEAAFTQYFGIRPDSDLRRLTREDVPQHNEAFWV